MKRNAAVDPRIRKKRRLWFSIVATYFIVLILTTGQGLILATYMGWGRDGQMIPSGFILGMLVYWAIISAMICLFTTRQMETRMALPLRKLSEAIQHVARGDFSVSIKPLHSPDQYDYTDVMFEDFNKMVEELASTETLKTDFIAHVSHEVKTPIAVIQNYAAALRSGSISDVQLKEYVETIVAASQKLSELVTNILRLNKLENQEINPQRTPFDLCRQITECALTFEEALEEKEIDFSVQMDDRLTINADEGLLQIIWHNLLSNAIKFTDPGGKISLTQTSEQGGVTVVVKDSGMGMSPHTLSHIFDKFFQADTSRSSDGNGLGLALTLRAIELTGSSIAVHSQPGKGSVFTVRLKTDR